MAAFSAAQTPTVFTFENIELSFDKYQAACLRFCCTFYRRKMRMKYHMDYVKTKTMTERTLYRRFFPCRYNKKASVLIFMKRSKRERMEHYRPKAMTGQENGGKI